MDNTHNTNAPETNHNCDKRIGTVGSSAQEEDMIENKCFFFTATKKKRMSINRTAAFLGGCLLVRATWAYAAYRLPAHQVWWLGFPALVIGLGFWILFLFHLRPTGREVNNERIWWTNLRPIHGTLYLVFAWMAFTRNNRAYLPLTIDVVFGLMAFVAHRVY